MTHINAFYADVEEKRQAVVRAQGELNAAVTALETHPDYVPVGQTDQATPVESEEKSTKK